MGANFLGYKDWNLFIILVFKRWREDRTVQMRHKLPKVTTGLAETGVQNVFRIWISKHTTRWNIIARLSWIGLFFTMIDVSTNYAIVISVVSRHLVMQVTPLWQITHTHTLIPFKKLIITLFDVDKRHITKYRVLLKLCIAYPHRRSVRLLSVLCKERLLQNTWQ